MRYIPSIGLYNTPYYDVESVGGVFYFLNLGFSRYFGDSLGHCIDCPSIYVSDYSFNIFKRFLDILYNKITPFKYASK
jgi:hypothetical protein